METGLNGKKRMIRRDGDSTIDTNLLNNVPLFLRDLLARLPPHTGPPPDIDTFLDHLKKTVLPPRPVTDERDENPSQPTTTTTTTSTLGILNNSSSGTIGAGNSATGNVNGLNSSIKQLNGTINGGPEDDVILLSGTKKKHNYDEDDEDDIRGDRQDDEGRDDIFQQRCRRRMAQE